MKWTHFWALSVKSLHVQRIVLIDVLRSVYGEKTSCSYFVYEITLINYIYYTIMTAVNVSATLGMSMTVEEMSAIVEKLDIF